MLKSLILVALVSTAATTVDTPTNPKDRQLECLAKNVYYESRGESYLGKVAVAVVTLNRTNHPKYPDTICRVVNQRKAFSWVADKKLQRKKLDFDSYNESYKVAKYAITNYNNTILGNFPATHFHAVYVNPKWKLKRIAKIGKHIYYA